jgi:hypothetical protein
MLGPHETSRPAGAGHGFGAHGRGADYIARLYEVGNRARRSGIAGEDLRPIREHASELVPETLHQYLGVWCRSMENQQIQGVACRPNPPADSTSGTSGSSLSNY